MYVQIPVLISPCCVFPFQKDSLRFAMVLNRAIKLGLFSPQYVTVLGYSMGAQIAGHVCRHLDKKCGHIIGDHAHQLDNTSEQYTIIIFSNSHLTMLSMSLLLDHFGRRG